MLKFILKVQKQWWEHCWPVAINQVSGIKLHLAIFFTATRTVEMPLSDKKAFDDVVTYDELY